MSEKVWLVSFDTDRVKDYIFATSDLKKIRGASALLEELNKEKTPREIRKIYPNLPDEHIIVGGGVAMTIVPSAELAAKVKAQIEALYRAETFTCSTTGVYLEIPEAELHTSAFGTHMKRLGVKLREAKDAKGAEVAFPLTPYTRPCDACGHYPSVQIDPDDPNQALCRSCLKKHENSKPARSFFWQEFRKFVKNHGGPESPWLKAEEPEDFDDIGRTSSPPGYLGFICADGNEIGRLWEKVRDFHAYYHLATGLDELIRRITYRALKEVLKEPRQNIFPFEILLMGGDDLMLVVAADAALKVAIRIAEYFENEANELAHSPEAGIPSGEHLSLSVGVVIAHDHFPIKAMYDLAMQLLRRAKRRASERKKRDQRPCGTVDFMVVTEAATAGLEKVRGEMLTERSFVVPPSRGEEFTLTERPYTYEELQKLINWAWRFKKKGFPRSSLYAMYEALFQSKTQAQLTALAVLGRAKQEHRDLGIHFFKDFGVSLFSLPWRERGKGKFSTPLGDLIEIYPFVRGGTDALDIS